MRPLAIVLFISALVACGGARPAPREARQSDVITATELARQGPITARQAIERLRPAFLRVRGPTSIRNPEADRVVIYVDNTRMGGVEILDQINASEIEEIRYLSGPSATSRYGTNHSGGAIVITRK